MLLTPHKFGCQPLAQQGINNVLLRPVCVLHITKTMPTAWHYTVNNATQDARLTFTLHACVSGCLRTGQVYVM